MYDIAINAIGFQLGWWACIAGVGHELEIPAVAFCSALIVYQFFISNDRYQEAKLALAFFILGLLLDSTLQYAGVISFYGWAFEWLSPFWLWTLWVMFSLTMNASMSFLKELPLWISALAGLLFGPLTYATGAAFGAASFQISISRILAIGFSWMIVLPLMVYLSQEILTPNKGCK